MMDPKGLGALIVFGLNGREKHAGSLSFCQHIRQI